MSNADTAALESVAIEPNGSAAPADAARKVVGGKVVGGDATTAPVGGRGAPGGGFDVWWLGLVLPVAIGLVWEIVVANGLANGRLVPPPSRIFATLSELAATGELWKHIAVTTWRVAVGFVFGTVAATLLGALAGYSRIVRSLLDPSLQGLRAVPSIAWVPLFILWLGIFEASKVTLIAVGVFFPIYLGVLGAILTVDRKIVEVGRVFRLTPLQLVRRILMPAILPAYIVALRGGLGLGWMFVVAAEFMGASEGLGYLLVDGQQVGKPAQIVAAILIFAVLGKLSDSLLSWATNPLLRWQDTHINRT